MIEINKKLAEINKKLAIVAIIIGIVYGIVACNKDILDLTYKYNYCYIQLQDGTVLQGEVESWTDYEDGDQLQIRMNGKTYLVHSINRTLIYDPSREKEY